MTHLHGKVRHPRYATSPGEHLRQVRVPFSLPAMDTLGCLQYCSNNCDASCAKMYRFRLSLGLTSLRREVGAVLHGRQQTLHTILPRLAPRRGHSSFAAQRRQKPEAAVTDYKPCAPMV
ncbi:hypothetical protein DPMN_135080 [Dreissena polymorpha]|uniref:Uncharacterized protein n=1 Tax=Dreissena polymorpha TaxID=45954 RepID=A0A9D4FWW0_DREPO|nr:hypothetical protein DPMN_135080 [Dreissena polymorpha]